ncbi:uncharacterized protein si:dkeyp-97a10.3 isoform X2 [Micropterus dolomieu]|uniref:uncharacterized protein si:dkeyp-97a10.3 isoform X2 n=1 Tax=Micropterus dolomieu TaxID=147949 RepID=UPI001E8EE371|nr:uncharacterized protein si:dkeyp-97a10.3 isoform X2 [Micropterus dolomieu]
MRQPLLLISVPLAVLLSANVLAQQQVPIQFQTDPVLVQTGTNIVFTVLTTPQVLSMTWQYKGVTLGLWAGGQSTLNSVLQFQGRVTITANQLQIGNAQLGDAGNYTVQVIPLAATGLALNSGSVQLSVFDAVAGVRLLVPSVPVEGRNVSLQCAWTAGTAITVQWGKGGVAVTASSRITFSGGFLILNPAIRGDSGQYTCTASNPVSAQTATQTLTVYYGPDTPVLTKDTSSQCVGGGDAVVGQTVRLTCMSDSLPPALFSWQHNGQSVTATQAGSGVITIQTFSTNDSGSYVCTASNMITGGTSQLGTVLTIIDICLNVGQVVGIVIGCLLLILIIVLLIVLIVLLMRRRRAQQRQEDTVPVQKTNPNPRPTPPDPHPNRARDLGQGPHPPLYYTRDRDHIYTDPRENHTTQHNDRTHTNRLLHTSIQNTNSHPHNGNDNSAFTHSDAQNANTFPNTQQQNPNILIQTGNAQGGAQLPAVHVSLNPLPQTAQQNNNAQMPTIHVNLNSFPTNGQQTQQDSSYPVTNTADNNASQTQQNLIRTGQSNPTMQIRQSNQSDPQLNGHTETGHQDQPGLIPTGYTHYNSNNTSQRNANTQTYQQELEANSRNSRSHDTTASSSRQQMPWDRLRGTPAYPSGTLQRGQTSPEYNSDTTDYTTHPPMREARMPNRSQPQSQSQNTSRSRAQPRQDAPSVDRQTQSRSADLRGPNTHSVTQLEAAHHTQRRPHTQRDSAQRDIRASPGSQTAPRQEATHSNNPRALPLMSQQASGGHSALSQGPRTQQGLTAPQGADTRALADPNHLPQAHMAQQHIAAPIQTPPQGLGTQTQPVIRGASQPRQGGTAPVPFSSAQPNLSNLTQAALRAHTERAEIFQNRKQQTQASLLHPGPQAAGAQDPPIPPPAIPLTVFQALPKKRAPDKSPTRTGNGHMHVSAHRHGHPAHRHPSHFTQPWQQQAHRRRPR